MTGSVARAKDLFTICNVVCDMRKSLIVRTSNESKLTLMYGFATVYPSRLATSSPIWIIVWIQMRPAVTFRKCLIKLSIWALEIRTYVTFVKQVDDLSKEHFLIMTCRVRYHIDNITRPRIFVHMVSHIVIKAL